MKDRYIKFSEANRNIPVFGQPWFLDIVCDGDWSAALAFDKEGNISGAWPHMFRKKKGFSFLQMPPFTPFLGPYIFYQKHINSEYKRNSFYFKTVQDLSSQLPKASYTSLKLSPQNEIWYPLHGKGYQQTSRYTYVINYKIGIEKINRNLKPQLRNAVSKADRIDDISVSNDYETFLDLLKNTFNQNNIGQFFHGEKIEHIITEAISKNQGSLYSYKDMAAGIFVLEDEKKCYLLFTASNKTGKSEDGVAQLIWTAIQDAVAKEKDFDFEGSMLPGVEKFFRSFGGKQQSYHLVTKITNPLMKVYKFLRP